MAEATGGDARLGPSDYLAAERTFLAWIRTGIALMGFGFVVARFGLFLQEFQAMESSLPARSSGLSLAFGTGLIALGVAVNVFSAWQQVRLVRELNRGGTSYRRPSPIAITLALVLAATGVALAIYVTLFRIHEGPQSEQNQEKSMSMNAGNGIIRKPSNHSVNETVAKLTGILEAKGVKLFAVVDHSGEAEKAGMNMPPTKLLIFGNPKAGTPLMLASPSIAIDLPLKILVSEDANGKVWLSYNSPDYLKQRHNLPADLLPNISVVEVLATTAGE
jgi:uncharacterized protein (DUF302 family)/uncharacterized membrane protein YidH (DUF202 family)